MKKEGVKNGFNFLFTFFHTIKEMAGLRMRMENYSRSRLDLEEEYVFQRNQPKNVVEFPLLQTQDLATLIIPHNNVSHKESYSSRDYQIPGTIDSDYAKAWYQPEHYFSDQQIQEEEQSWIGVL